jgi:hypothetical protein
MEQGKNLTQESAKIKDEAKNVSNDIVYDIKELLKESAQNTQKTIGTKKIFV